MLKLVDDPDKFLTKAKEKKRETEDELINKFSELNNLRPNTLRIKLSVLKSFFDYEEVQFNFKRISRTLPKARPYSNDRPPTVSEIRQLFDYCGTRNKVIVLIMLSSGCRVGAFNSFTIGDYKRLDSGIGQIKIYRGSDEEYYSFLTPECCDLLEKYLDDRRKNNEVFTSSSPLIRLVYSKKPRTKILPKVKVMKGSIISRQLYYLWRESGIKNIGNFEIKSAHCFRKFFKTRAGQVMKRDDVETLMGHSLSVSSSYYKPTLEYLSNEYLKAVNLLTISEAVEIKYQAEAEKKNLESELSTLRHDLGLLQSSVTALIASQVASSQIANHNHNENNDSN
ncbi:tyrosine-type recombinase/integrase [Thermoproteota archaeon]